MHVMTMLVGIPLLVEVLKELIHSLFARYLKQ